MTHEVERLRRDEQHRGPVSLPATSRPIRNTPSPSKPPTPRLRLAGLDAEELEQLLLPLAEQRLGRDQQDAPRALGQELGDDEARLDRLSEPDLVREDAAALAQAGEREDDRVDLVRVRIDLRGALRRGVAALFVGAAQADEVLGEIPPLRGV